MATIDDFGGTTDPLNAPQLGGPTGWAAAVRDYLKGIDTSAGVEGLVTLAPDWVDYGAGYSGLFVTRVGRLATIDMLVRRSADLAMTAATSYQIGTLPTGFRPARDVIAVNVYSLSSPLLVGRITVVRGGAVSFSPSASGTLVPGQGYVSVCVTYRAGS